MNVFVIVDDPEYIETERGRGHRFVRPREQAGRHGVVQIAVGFLESGLAGRS
jgi:hypothetical protein